MDEKFEDLTAEDFDSVTDEERSEFFKRADWKRDNREGLTRSRYIIYCSHRNDLCTVYDVSNEVDAGKEDCRYFTLDQYDEIEEWLAETGSV